MSDLTEPVVENLSRFKVIGWAGEYGSWFDPTYLPDEPCPECEDES